MATISSIPGKPYTHKVVVYGATGYTGQLASEFLAKLSIPFTVAGRNQTKLDLLARQYREKGADCTARACKHTPAGLKELLKDAEVVINISGPFSLLGPAVVEAALANNCHYLDSTGEQDFMLDMRNRLGAAFKAKNLILTPSTAFLWGLGTLGTDICEKESGIHTVEVVYAPPSLQTMASLQSMWRTTRRDNFSLKNAKLNKLPTAEMCKKNLPDGRSINALRVGTGEPTFLLGQSTIQNFEAYFASDTLARAVPIFRFWKFLNGFVSGERLDRWSDTLVERFKKNPQREEPDTGRFVVETKGTGPTGSMSVIMNGYSPYMLTGFLCAAAAQALLEGRQVNSGYVSLAKAFGADYMIKRLEEVGTFTTVRKNLDKSGTRTARTA